MYITDFKMVSLHIADFLKFNHLTGGQIEENLFHRVKGIYRVIS